MSTALRIAYGSFGRVALLDMDRSLVRHAHPHCHVLIKAEGADTAFAVGDRLIALTDHQAVLVNAWEPHAYVHDPTKKRTVILALYIEPQWLRSIQRTWAASGGPGFFDRPAGEVSPRIRALAMDLATVMVSDPAGRATQEQLLSDLMISVIERFTPWRTFAEALVRSADHHGFDWRIRRAVELIRSTPRRGISIDNLAREAGLSRAHFYRLFQRSTQVSPHVYLNVVRMELAVKSVVDSSESLAAVSDALGFAAPAHFTRFFREHAGVKPSEFRAVTRMGLA
jgi:AraC family transcriptional regulator